MNRRTLLAGGAAGAALWLLLSTASPGGAEDGFRPLYNGRDLSGWHVKSGKLEAWKADGELLSCILPGGGWLTTDKEYSDFILRLEYRIPPGGNSGVGLRYPPQGDPAHNGMEIQILDDNAPEYRGKLIQAQYTGGIYYQSAPAAHPAKPPGQWNKYWIRCQGPRVIVRLNGVEIQNVNVEEFTQGQGGHKALAARPRRGFIGFQSHGHQVDFRKIKIRELGPSQP